MGNFTGFYWFFLSFVDQALRTLKRFCPLLIFLLWVQIAAQLLNTKQVSIFTTRILCKMPKIGISIPWHQDSMYWPLEPLKVVSFWLALDDVNNLNGGMSSFISQQQNTI